MPEELIQEAERYGINATMYYLLPPKTRVKALKKDIAKAKAATVMAVAKGDNDDS